MYRDADLATILVVEDDPVLGQVLCRVLARDGHVVLQAHSASQTLELVGERCDFFDRRGVTLRQGDLRRINPARLDLFEVGSESGDDAHGGESSPVGRPDFKSVWGSEPVLGGFDSHSLPPVSKRTV